MVTYMKLSELQKKDIVNINTGERVGNIVDININVDGYISSLVVDKTNFRFLFSSNDEIEVTFKEIVKIGEDVILVKSDN